MSFMEESYNKPSGPQGSGGDPMAKWRERKAARAGQTSGPQEQGSGPEPMRSRSSGTPDSSARSTRRYGQRRQEPQAPQQSSSPAPMRSRYGMRPTQQDRPGMIGAPASFPGQGRSPFVSPGNMGGIMNTPGLPGHEGGDAGRVGRMMDDVTSGRTQGPQMGMEPSDNAYGFGMGNPRMEPRRDRLDPERMQSLRMMLQERFGGQMRRPQPAPRPQPRGLGGLVAANNANIRGRGGELAPVQPRRFERDLMY